MSKFDPPEQPICRDCERPIAGAVYNCSVCNGTVCVYCWSDHLDLHDDYFGDNDA